MGFIDLIDRDCLISDLETGKTYLVGRSDRKNLYLCKRVNRNLLICNFKFNLQYDFVMRVENLTEVYGFNKFENAFFTERVVFSRITLWDLLYVRLPAFRGVPRGTSYIKELLPAVSFQQFEALEIN